LHFSSCMSLHDAVQCCCTVYIFAESKVCERALCRRPGAVASSVLPRLFFELSVATHSLYAFSRSNCNCPTVPGRQNRPGMAPFTRVPALNRTYFAPSGAFHASTRRSVGWTRIRNAPSARTGVSSPAHLADLQIQTVHAMEELARLTLAPIF